MKTPPNLRGEAKATDGTRRRAPSGRAHPPDHPHGAQAGRAKLGSDPNLAGAADALARLQNLTTGQLRLEWQAAFGTPAPRSLRRNLLLRAVAYGIQEQAAGGLGKVARRRLAAHAGRGKDSGTASPASLPPRRLKAGTRLVREWRGEIHQETVTEMGFDYRGRRHVSLSEIARLITGTRWSGPLFFGLRDSGRTNLAPPQAAARRSRAGQEAPSDAV
jgi:hypothetical protein